MASMGKGDEVLTSGGLVGKITKISEENDYISIELNTNNEVVIKKDFHYCSATKRYAEVSIKQLKDPRCAKPLSIMEVSDGGVYHRYRSFVRTSKYLR